MAEKHTHGRERRLLLASTSPYRRELLSRLRRPFDVVRPAVVEGALAGEAPVETAIRLARAKAQEVAVRHPDALVVGSDQVCECDGRVLGKPLTLEANRQMLLSLSGRTAVFHTAVALIGVDAHVLRQHVDVTHCVIRRLDAAAVDDYLGKEPSLDCAGGFKVEGYGISLCDRVESQDPTGIVGLPLIWLSGALRHAV